MGIEAAFLLEGLLQPHCPTPAIAIADAASRAQLIAMSIRLTSPPHTLAGPMASSLYRHTIAGEVEPTSIAPPTAWKRSRVRCPGQTPALIERVVIAPADQRSAFPEQRRIAVCTGNPGDAVKCTPTTLCCGELRSGVGDLPLQAVDTAASHQPSAISHQPSAVSNQQSAISDQRSAISDQRSAISDQRSAISNQPKTPPIRMLS
jgi:hypothetical protein